VGCLRAEKRDSRLERKDRELRELFIKLGSDELKDGWVLGYSRPWAKYLIRGPHQVFLDFFNDPENARIVGLLDAQCETMRRENRPWDYHKKWIKGDMR
jgi:hypothetical protein